jgi:hypothetical protein
MDYGCGQVGHLVGISFWPARKVFNRKGRKVAKKTLRSSAKNWKAETAAVVAAAVSPLFEKR